MLEVACQLLTDQSHAGYATYVERDYSGQVFYIDCDNDSVTMLRALVYSSWVMMAFNW